MRGKTNWIACKIATHNPGRIDFVRNHAKRSAGKKHPNALNCSKTRLSCSA